MRMYDIIQKKRDGKELGSEEISFLIKGYVEGNIPDYQMSAFTMAVYFKGMTKKETAVLTDEMARSGDMVDLSILGNKTVDKHSTGGVGDKTTLIVAPIVACLGGKVAKMSGRGLGHTGGTVDKLESIEGYKVELTSEKFIEQVKNIGLAVVGQSGNLAPADKKIYALRDVTATVDCMPLIASSIMSKKIASGSKSIVLDVKVGSGAFMKTYEEAKELAEEMVSIGKNFDRNVTAVITNMNIPLGSAIGNSLEVKEAIEILNGKGCTDLREVCIELSANMLSLCNGWKIEESRKKAIQSLDDGSALKKFKEWIENQGGNKNWIDNPELFPQSKIKYNVLSPINGYISEVDAEKLGIIAVSLGAGREKKEDGIDYSAGIILNKKSGEKVIKGEVLAVLHTSKENIIKSAETEFISALRFSDSYNESKKGKLIFGTIN